MSIIDSSVKPKNITLNNGASISSSKSRFGAGSLLLNGSNQYANIANNTDFGFGAGDFTIEMWVYPVDNSNRRTLIEIGNYTDGILWRMGPGSDQLWINNAHWDWGSSSVPLNVWNHLALVRNNGIVKTYINGSESFLISAAGNLGSSKPVFLGGRTDGTETFNGYIDEIRITKGIGSARYTSDFDVRTLLAPFPSSGTPITPPEAISNLSTLARDQRIDLTWTIPTEDNGGIITDYSLQYTTDDPTNSPTYYEYSHPASVSSSGSISGLVNGTTYAVRVAPINVAGTGSYVSQSNVMPILPPALSISQEPLNNRVTTNTETASFSVSGELTNNSINATFSYQWQKYSFNFNNQNYEWSNIDNGTSSTITLTSDSFPNWDWLGYDSVGPVRCFLTSAYETKMTKTARLVNAGAILDFFYAEIMLPYSGGGSFNGNTYNGYTLNSNERASLYAQFYSYMYDDSWYTGNDSRLKFQYSLNGTSWSDVDSVYSYDFRINNVGSISLQTPSIDLSGRVYFRIVLEDLWPRNTNDGTSSTSESSYSKIINYYWIDYNATAPGAPSNVVADPGDGLAIVSWNAPTITGGVTTTSYTVQYALNGGSWTTFGTSASTSLIVTGLNNGSGNNYVFRVAASNSSGTGSYSNSSSNVTPDASYATIPEAPTNATAIAGNAEALLSWVVPTNIGKSVLTNYIIEYSTDNGVIWTTYTDPIS